MSEHLMRLILQLREVGVTDPNLLRAMEATPRDQFVPRAFTPQAWEDTSLPIANGQQILSPSLTGQMVGALNLHDRCKALVIGTGSGYMTAIISQLCRRVFTIEHHKELYDQARQQFHALRLENIVTKRGDGQGGWPDQAPFDCIVIAAAVVASPDAILDQLRDGGICVVPVGAPTNQQIMVYEKTPETISARALCSSKIPMMETIRP